MGCERIERPADRQGERMVSRVCVCICVLHPTENMLQDG
jgi:hypothetical protein